MTNYEWLLQMGGEERQAWFDAQHVDANDALSAENDVSAESVDANDANDALQLMRECCVADILDALGIDRREKNHTRKIVQALADMVERDYVRRDAEEHVDAPKRSEMLRNEQDSREKLEADASELTADYAASGDVCDALYGGIVGLLDRQASITRREVLTHPDERDEQIAELTAERDELADDLLTCNKEREEYRELLSKAITQAAEIVNLQQ